MGNAAVGYHAVPLADSRAEAVQHQGFEELVAEHCGFVWRLLRRLGLGSADADDAAQQVFMIASRKLEHIGPGQARGFLYGVAVRVARTARRGIERRGEVLGDPADRPAPDDQGPEHGTELSRACSLLDELLGRLPDELRRVLVLAELEQFEVAEIAALEQIPAGTAASRLRRARERFRAFLAELGERNPFGGRP